MKHLRFLLFSVLFSCSMRSADNAQLPEKFDIQGHRGCRGLMPENTIPAMIRALQIGVTTLEMDAVVTKDKKVILSHEPFMSHELATAPDGTVPGIGNEKSFNIYEMNYADIEKWDVGSMFHKRFPEQQKLKLHKPLLSDVIDSVENYIKQHKLRPVYYNIETKCQPSTDNVFHPAPDEFTSLLMDVINRKGIAGRVIIQSFDPRTLRVVHNSFPGIATALLVEGLSNPNHQTKLTDLGFTPSIYSPEYHLVNPSLLSFCRDKKMKLIPWTVNDSAEIVRLRSMGVDGIITDYPDRALKN